MQQTKAAPANHVNDLRDPSRRAVLAQQAAIVHIGQRALEERSLDVLLNESCELVCDVLDADFVSIAELDAVERTLRVVGGVGWKPGVVGELILGSGPESQAGFTLADGGPVIVDDYDTEARFRVVAQLVDGGARSGMSVRIGAADSPYGTLSVFSARKVTYSADDANFMRAVANVLGAAIGRLAVERELRESRDQLAAIVESIDEGITVLDRNRILFANETAAHISGYDSAQQLIAAAGEIKGRYELFDDDGHSLGLEQLPSRRALDGEERPEQIVGFRDDSGSEMKWSTVRAVGVRDHAGEISSVITVFRDVTDDRWAAETRKYMADAVAVLSSTLDVGEAAQRLATLTVPRLADYVTVSMVQRDGSIKLVGLAHVNPERVDMVRQLERGLPPPDPNAPTGLSRVIRANVVDQGIVTPEMIDAAPVSDEQRTLLHRLELHAYVTVPLNGRSKPIGALSLVMAESGRELRPREVELALELGARAGVALENALLFQEVDARRQELDAVLTNLADAVLVYDAEGKLRMGNAAAEQTFHGNLPLTLDELWNRAKVDPAANDDKREQDETDSTPREVEVDAHGRWHELRSYSAAAVTDPLIGVEGAAPTVVVMRDITDVRAARAAREAFMGVLSHELRTPITTIYGGSELISRDLDDEQRAEVIADIRVEAERLVRLVEDLLVMTRVERGMVEVSDEPILLQHLLASIIRATDSRWPEARITLHAADRLPAVRGDFTYVEQVVRNFMTNAMRYGQGLEKGIDVVAEEGDGEVIVRVLDRGNGLRGEDPERLFELFYRSSTARSVPGGAGIGLFVCRNLIDKMGGRVWARERDGGGAEFGFALPVLGADAAG